MTDEQQRAATTTPFDLLSLDVIDAGLASLHPWIMFHLALTYRRYAVYCRERWRAHGMHLRFVDYMLVTHGFVRADRHRASWAWLPDDHPRRQHRWFELAQHERGMRQLAVDAKLAPCAADAYGGWYRHGDYAFRASNDELTTACVPANMMALYRHHTQFALPAARDPWLRVCFRYGRLHANVGAQQPSLVISMTPRFTRDRQRHVIIAFHQHGLLHSLDLSQPSLIVMTWQQHQYQWRNSRGGRRLEMWHDTHKLYYQREVWDTQDDSVIIR